MMPADRTPGISRNLHSLAIAAVSMAVACVYFNALYNANKLFDQGSKQVKAGSTAQGRATLEQGIEKAEHIFASHPDSKWADDALRLIVRARLLREEWAEAAEASRLLMPYATSRRDSARTAGYLGTALAHLDQPNDADSLLSIALPEEKDSRIRSELLLDRARARHQLARVEGADEDFQEAARLRPDWLDPRLGRARLLVDYDRGSEAAFDLSGALKMLTPGHEEAKVMETVVYVARLSPESGLSALTDVESSGLSLANKATMITLRGSLRREKGQYAAARADFALAIRTAGNSRSGVAPYLAIARLDLIALSAMEELALVMGLVEEGTLLPPGPGSTELNRMRDTGERVEYWVDMGGLGYLAAAEAARDELGAPRLARQLFLDYVRLNPEALWAPKALLAALDLTNVDSGRQDNGPPEEPSAEELRRRLTEDYGDSAYVQVFIGGTGGEFTYEELEAGLRRQLQRLETLANQALRPAATQH